MSGVKGRSGGARANSGGARPGAGRPPKERKPLEIPPGSDSLVFLLSVQNDPEADPALRVRAAIAAVQYQHPKMGEGGKKHAEKAGVDKAKQGRYAGAEPPKLVVNNK